MFNNLLTDYLVDVLTETEDGYGLFGGKISVLSFVVLCVLAVIAVISAVVFFADRKNLADVMKYIFEGFVLFAIAVGIFLICLSIYKYAAKGKLVNLVFVPTLVTAVLSLATAVCLFLCGKKKTTNKTVSRILIGITIASFVVALVCITVYYYTKISDGKEYYTEEYAKFNSAALYASAMILVTALIAAALFLDKSPFTFSSRDIAYAGICVALSFALSYVKLFSMPQGGSITLLSALPLTVFAYAFGLRKGLAAGLIYGLLQSVQTPYIIHPAQFLLDYPIAFSSLGAAGLFSGLKTKNDALKYGLGAAAAGVLRYASHVLSGVFAFGAWADLTAFPNLWAYSAAYNFYVFVDVALAAVAGIIVLSSKSAKKSLLKR